MLCKLRDINCVISDPLTDQEVQEAAELKKRFPPDPERAKLSEPFSRILRKLEEQEGKKG